MPLQKTPVSLNFAKGMDTKTDPFQISMDSFALLTNSVFDTLGRLTKRNGFQTITRQPELNGNTNLLQTNLTTLNDNLVTTGNELFAYNSDSDQWSQKGIVQPVQLSVNTITRTTTSQTSQDAAVAANNLVCTVYADSNGNNYYQISDSITGQSILPRVELESTALYPRVFVLGVYFVVTYTTSANNLKYIAIPVVNPFNPRAAVTYSSTLIYGEGYDGIVAGNQLYLSWCSTGDTISTGFLTPALLASGASISTTAAPTELVSLTTDPVNDVLYVTYYSGGTLYCISYSYALTPLMTTTTVTSAPNIVRITSSYLNGLLFIFTELLNSVTELQNSDQNYISGVIVTPSTTGAGTPGTPYVILRSLGLSSKSFIQYQYILNGAPNTLITSNVLPSSPANMYTLLNATIYMLAAYGESATPPPPAVPDTPPTSNQPTYLLIDGTGQIYMRLAYSNGGGYATTQVLSNVTYQNSTWYTPYLYKDNLTSVNKGTATGVPSAAIYTQTGVNLASFTINDNQQYSSEIAGSLHLTGGMLWQYDGSIPVEHGFHIWPEDQSIVPDMTGGGLAPQVYYYQFTYEWTDAIGNTHRSAPSIPITTTLTTTPITFTSTFTAGVSSITVSSAAGLQIGQIITDVSTPTPVTFKSVFEANETFLTITSASGALYVGDILTDTTTPTNLQANTQIVSISGSTIEISLPTVAASTTTPGDVISTSTSQTLQADTFITSISGTTIGLSLPTLTATGGGGDTFETVDTGSNTLYVPTLRLTSKQPNPQQVVALDPVTNPVRIVGYRWSEGQQNYYQFTSIQDPVLNDPTVDYVTIIDTSPDNQIIGNPLIYTTGGVVEDIAAPASSASTLFNNRLWLVDSEDRNLLWFSKQVIEAVPVEMSDLLTIYVAPTSGAQGSTGEITALAPMDDKLVIFKRDAIYYINGIGPDNTGANSQYSDPIFITSSVGCNNPNSIVLMKDGLMFQSDKGIWILARDLSTTYIGAPVEAYNNYIVMSAQSIPVTNQVRFIMNRSVTLMYDYFVNQWGVHTNISAISGTLYQNSQTYLNAFGSIFQETPGTFLDGTEPVLIGLTTAWINIAGLQGYERFYFAYLLGTYFTPFTLNVSLAYNYNPSPIQNIKITPDNYVAPWGGEAQWGSGGPWGAGAGQANIFETRIFPQNQKCESFQISIQEVHDSTYGAAAGQGLSLSGLNMVVGVKRGFRTQRASRSFGTN
jgi:hypothetical protein